MMRQLILLILSTLFFTLLMAEGLANSTDCTSLRVMTFNIRYDEPADGENRWEKRKDRVISMIRFHKAEVIGLQEALKHQIEYLAKEMSEYAWFGVGRDDGAEKGEFTAVFYLKSRLECLRDSTFWYSETPEKPSKGWDAALNRTATWGKFFDKVSKKHFYFFNTHFDHKGEVARVESARLLLKKVQKIALNEPAVVLGDFNVLPDSEVYNVMTMEGDLGKKQALKDARYASIQKHHGPNGTFTAFDPSILPKGPLDYIFVTKNVRVLSHGNLADIIEGRYPSDHFPVLAEVEFP